mgnify:CR=1 FL=1
MCGFNSNYSKINLATFFNFGVNTWTRDPRGNEPYESDNTGYNQSGAKMTLIPDSTQIIPIYVATANDILEAATGEDQNDDGVFTTYTDFDIVFNQLTGRIEEGKEEYITTNLTYSHSASDYGLLDTLFDVGPDTTGLSEDVMKAIKDPTTGDIAWAIVVTRYKALYGLNSGAIIVSDVVMELPVEINLTDLTVTQEIDFNNKNDITDLLDELEDNNQNIPTIELTLTAVNELPLGVSIDMHFLNADSISQYSQENVQLIDAPTFAGGTIAATTSSNSIILDAEAIEALKTTETVQLVLSLNTPDGVFLPLQQTAQINVTLSLKVTN